jgi:hypothetical protein
VKDCPLRGAVGQPALRQVGGAKGSLHQTARVSACNANALSEGRILFVCLLLYGTAAQFDYWCQQWYATEICRIRAGRVHSY